MVRALLPTPPAPTATNLYSVIVRLAELGPIPSSWVCSCSVLVIYILVPLVTQLASYSLGIIHNSVMK